MIYDIELATSIHSAENLLYKVQKYLFYELNLRFKVNDPDV